MSEQRCSELDQPSSDTTTASSQSLIANSGNSPSQHIIAIKTRERFQLSDQPDTLNQANQTTTNQSQKHSTQTAPNDIAPPLSIDGTAEDDLNSYWSDSAASANCGRLSGSDLYPNTNSPASCSNSLSNLKVAARSASGSSSSAASKRCNTTTGKGASGARNGRKRVMANERERERTRSLNQALEILRNRLPVPEAEKRSKIQTLRMAKEYIEFLAKFKRMSQQQVVVDGANNLTIEQQQNQNIPDSPLTYKFYKFRLKSQTRND